MFMKTVQIVALIVIIETLCKVSLKHGAMNGSLGKGHGVEKYLIYGAIGYAVIAYCLWNSFITANMGQVNLIWCCSSIIVAFIAGYLLFQEPINRYTLYSIMFVLIAVYFSYLSEMENIK